VSSGGRRCHRPYPGGCPQRWTEVDTGEPLVEGGSCRYAVGDHGRLVEKLSPGMCTGWGDLVAAGSRQVTDRRIDGGGTWRPKSWAVPLDSTLTCVYVARRVVVRACHQRDEHGVGHGTRTAWGSSRDTQGTAGGRRPAAVHNRRDVHVSTQAMRSPPTAGQQPHSVPEQGEDPRSPASTRVMTRMSYLDR
jgi:hypothetical protein